MKKNLTICFTLLLFVFSGNAWVGAEEKTSSLSAHYNVGQWLLSDQVAYDKWLTELVQDTEEGDRPLLPVIQEFKELIEKDPQVYMLFHQMFEQLPQTSVYKKDPTGKLEITNYQQLLQVLNRILTTAPAFNTTGLVGFPINAVLNWPMGTPAGTELFLNEKVNRQLKKILSQWAVFLGSKDSRYVLTDDPERGWFGRDAKHAMSNFEKDFICDPKAPYHGFISWDDFFTRVFRDGRRPVASPENDNVVANACESAPYKIARNVKLQDRFWIKAQPYSLQHMMAMDPLTAQFENGTVYQAFLSALSYHRWHSPVSGRIVKTKIIDGSYYAE